MDNIVTQDYLVPTGNTTALQNDEPFFAYVTPHAPHVTATQLSEADHTCQVTTKKESDPSFC